MPSASTVPAWLRMPTCHDKTCHHRHDPEAGVVSGPPCAGCRWCQATPAVRAAVSQGRDTGAVHTDLLSRLVEAHRPSQRPYDGAPGFVLTHCRVCDGNRARVQQAGDKPYTCRVWQEAFDVGVPAC
jgi:hypothetical protein